MPLYSGGIFVLVETQDFASPAVGATRRKILRLYSTMLFLYYLTCFDNTVILQNPPCIYARCKL